MFCSESECTRPVRRRGLCETHYMRWYRHRDTTPEPPLTRISRRPLGFRRITPAGYVAIKVGPGKADYQLEHRLVAQRALRRVLGTDEHVHHINGDKQDNRWENLAVMANDDHQKLHDWQITKHRRRELVCERCGRSYLVKQSKVGASRFCSNACRLVALHEGNRKPVQP